MATYYYDDHHRHHHNHHNHHNHHHHHKEGYELAQNLSRDLRHGHQPTKYIINEGKLILDEQSLESLQHRGHGSKSNTIIYNSPGSTMWVQPTAQKSRLLEHHGHRTACRGCFRHHDRYYGGYCSDCLAERAKHASKRYETVVSSDRRILEYPERRALTWR
ncbi:hypothetical protein GGR50DRAFT_152441 [Xylaria sp. CBS 124048]|nr:hypothetical protein GGR50DRAFT_152441 [Xylaria sp. CBS 124048]